MKIRWWQGSMAFAIVAWVLVACGDGTTPPTPQVLSVAVTPTEAIVAVDQTLPLTATVEVTGGASKSVTWSSSNEDIATVDAAGIVTGVAPGAVQVTATSAVDAAKSAAAAITVEQVIEVDDAAGLREAVTTAPVGAVIALLAGVYELDATLQVALDREFRGSPGAILRLTDAAPVATAEAAPWADYGRPVLYAEGVSLKLSDVELEYAGEADATVIVLIEVDGNLRNVRVRGGTSAEPSTLLGHGIFARDSVLRLDGVEASSNDRVGIRLVSTEATLTDVTVSGNGAAGLAALEDSVVSATRLTSSGNAGAGLGAAGTARVTVQESTISENGAQGIYALVASNVTLDDVVVQDHPVGGLEVYDQAQATVVGGLFQRNAVGVDTNGDAVVRVEGATLRANGWVGAVARGGSSLTLVDVQALENTDHGALVHEASTLVVAGGRFADNGFQGLVVGGDATATVTGPTVEGNGGFGVLFDERAQVRMAEAIVTENGATGIQVAGNCEVVLEDNRSSGNDYAGIAVVGAATATGRANVASGNIGPGLHLSGGTSTFEANEIVGNATGGGAGLLVLGDAAAVLTGNEIADHPAAGIAVIQGATAEVVSNLVRDNGGYGIDFRGDAGGSVDGNVLRANGNCGVYLGSTGDVVLGDNTFEDNGGDDVCEPVVVTVTLTPTDAVLQAGQAASFSAEVSGSDDTRVVWQRSCGVIEGSGATIDYRAPVTGEDRCTLTATSVASPGYSAVAEIEVTPVEVVLDAITFTPAHPATLALNARVRIDWSWTSNIVGPYRVCAFVAARWTGCIAQSTPDGSATSELWRADAGTIDEVRLWFALDDAPFWQLWQQIVPVAYEWHEPPLELYGYVGTYARPDAGTLTHLGLVLRGQQPSADETITVTVTGPEAWGTFDLDIPWRTNWRTTGTLTWSIWKEPVSGTYEVTATVNGEPLSSTVTVDARVTLPQPSGETLIASDVDELALYWNPVPGAAFYEVHVNQEDVNHYYVVRSTVPEANYALHDLDLDPSARYFLRIIATSIDLQPALFRNAEPPPAQQLDAVIGGFVCFYPGDAAFSDCD